MGPADPLSRLSQRQNGDQGQAGVMGGPGDLLGVNGLELEEADQNDQDKVIRRYFVVVDQDLMQLVEFGRLLGLFVLLDMWHAERHGAHRRDYIWGGQGRQWHADCAQARAGACRARAAG